MSFKKKRKPGKAEAEPEPEVEPEPKKDKLSTKKEEDQIWIAKNVATQVEPVVFNNKEQKPYTVIQALVELLNRTE